MFVQLWLLRARQRLDERSLLLKHGGLIASSHDHRDAAALFDVDLVTRVADARDDLLYETKLLFRLVIDSLDIRLGPGRDNQRGGWPMPQVWFAGTIEILPDLFRDKRHERMQEAQTDNGFEGFRFIGYQIYEPLIAWDLTRQEFLTQGRENLREDPRARPGIRRNHRARATVQLARYAASRESGAHERRNETRHQ